MTFGALVIFSLAACKKDEKSTLPTEQLNNNTVETVLNSQPLVESGTFQGLVRLRLSGLTNRRISNVAVALAGIVNYRRYIIDADCFNIGRITGDFL